MDGPQPACSICASKRPSCFWRARAGVSSGDIAVPKLKNKPADWEDLCRQLMEWAGARLARPEKERGI
ncbi:hypothetical protein [Owariibacterium komagatae]|uniref:hypothetical protein n=1 Tax=Owariibacterium komagatae TaxID=3136601 RepID=UPI0038B3404D